MGEPVLPVGDDTAATEAAVSTNRKQEEWAGRGAIRGLESVLPIHLADAMLERAGHGRLPRGVARAVAARGVGVPRWTTGIDGIRGHGL